MSFAARERWAVVGFRGVFAIGWHSFLRVPMRISWIIVGTKAVFFYMLWPGPLFDHFLSRSLPPTIDFGLLRLDSGY
jgi:hypothetical protein